MEMVCSEIKQKVKEYIEKKEEGGTIKKYLSYPQQVKKHTNNRVSYLNKKKKGFSRSFK